MASAHFFMPSKLTNKTSAGSRDSELTNHGFQQAALLARHLIAIGHAFSHIFSSHLQRAFKTAELIREAQISANSTLPSTTSYVPDVKQLPVLMEQDFGCYEGKLWYQRPPGSRKLDERDINRDIPGFVDVESKESMTARMDAFLEEHLIPLIEQPSNENAVVAIVSHGIILTVLWRRLLIRLPPNSVTYSPELLATRRGFRLEHLGAWSNTGYLELHLRKKMSSLSSQPALGLEVPAGHLGIQPTSKIAPPITAVGEAAEDLQGDSGIQTRVQAQADSVTRENVENTLSHLQDIPTTAAPSLLCGWTTIIKAINGRDHLQGLKRTGGGVGSARHDDGQKSIETFFKRRRTS
jgi:broad specificity phosphatase PhoE